MANRQAQNFVYQDNPDPRYCKKCRYCRQLIDKKASICPFCRKSQPLIPPLACFAILAAIFGMFLFFYEPAESNEGKQSTSMSTEQMPASEYAEMHLKIYPYSYLGLISQLEEGGGYSHEESVNAADNCNADWNENAVKAAQGFAEFSATNVEDLKTLLKEDQFTDEQIEYAISKLK